MTTKVKTALSPFANQTKHTIPPVNLCPRETAKWMSDNIGQAPSTCLVTETLVHHVRENDNESAPHAACHGIIETVDPNNDKRNNYRHRRQPYIETNVTEMLYVHPMQPIYIKFPKDLSSRQELLRSTCCLASSRISFRKKTFPSHANFSMR